MVMSRVTKKWEIFPGRNKFCLNGHIVMGPDSTVFYINVFLIVGTTLLFLIFDCPFLAEKVSSCIPIITVIFFIFVMSTLFRTSFTDPGIIPRATADEAVYIEKQIKIAACGELSAERPPPRTKEIIIKGESVKLKYCFTCKIFRPPRASHCSLCDNCVDRFDHHCPWVGNCVGRRNYRYFYLFTVSLSFYIAFVFICTCTHLYLLSKNRVMVEAIADSPASVIVILITFFSCWSVFGLAGFHTYLAASNQTTNEDIKGSFSNKRGGTSRNPYSFGNACANCCYLLCGPFTSSLIDSEGFVTPERIDKKTFPERQPSRPPSAVIPPSNHPTMLHYHDNDLKPYSPADQIHNRTHSSVICNQPLSKQIAAKSTPCVPFEENYDSGRKKDVEKKNDNYQNKDETIIDISKIDLDLDDVEVSNGDKNTLALIPLSASKLQLLHDTTMIESALDLDSLEESTSSLGAGSHAGLIKGKLFF